MHTGNNSRLELRMQHIAFITRILIVTSVSNILLQVLLLILFDHVVQYQDTNNVTTAII